MNAAIEKRTKRNSKLRDAIDLIGYGHERIEGDQVERIIAEGIAGLAIALALLMPTDALAQSPHILRRMAGCRAARPPTAAARPRSTTPAAASPAASSTNGNQTTIYGSDGRSVGTVTTPAEAGAVAMTLDHLPPQSLFCLNHDEAHGCCTLNLPNS